MCSSDLNVLATTARLMRERRDELAGIVIRENGKDWRNADADVTEAIARCLSLSQSLTCNVAGPEVLSLRQIGAAIGERGDR